MRLHRPARIRLFSGVAIALLIFDFMTVRLLYRAQIIPFPEDPTKASEAQIPLASSASSGRERPGVFRLFAGRPELFGVFI
jgi:hypothetical protein